MRLEIYSSRPDKYEAAPTPNSAFSIAEEMFGRFGSAINITGMVRRDGREEEIVWAHVNSEGDVTLYADED